MKTILKALTLLAGAFYFPAYAVVTVPVTTPYAPAKAQTTYSCVPTGSVAFAGTVSVTDIDACFAHVNSKAAEDPRYDGADCYISTHQCGVYVLNSDGTHNYKGWGYATISGETSGYVCPPDSEPTYTVGPMDDPQYSGAPPVPQVCASPDEQCPMGFYHEPIPNPQGEGKVCVSITCPAAGTPVDFLVEQPGIIPWSDGPGVYCDGSYNLGCAISVTGNPTVYPEATKSVASGVSTGASCGSDHAGQYTVGDTRNCTLFDTQGTTQYAICNDAAPAPGPDDNSEFHDETGDDYEDYNECTEGDMICEYGNIRKAIENNEAGIKSKLSDLHNKEIDADKKNTDDIIAAIERLRKSNQDGFKSMLNGSNGTGSGGGLSGIGTIADTSDTVPDAESSGWDGPGMDSVKESVNVEDYTERYSHWLPDVDVCPLISASVIDFTIPELMIDFHTEINPDYICGITDFVSYLLMVSSLILGAKIIRGAW